ncbi:MAG: peptide chain release factor N(5)-glutamine methyltransferase [Candidatus Rokubacteria bacterium]|nr:peptide chain release factor N(5)-glutamine methyltransferase [Candidatus Rokubacteria bacterium]
MTVQQHSARAGDRLIAAVAALEAAGIAPARPEAEWLLADVLGVGRFDIYLALDRELSPAKADAYERAVARRTAGEPLQQIVGWESFCGLRIRVTPDVLVPRPETESLVEWALARLPRGPRRVVDVGTGSGCIAAAIAHARPDVSVLAAELSPAAARVARENIAALGFAARVRVVVADVLTAVAPDGVDVVVANPPYLPDAMLPALPREIRNWEPRGAVLAGADGLRVLARIVADAARVLVRDGSLLVETAGDAQVDAVAAMFERAGYAEVAIRADLTGTRRFVAGRRGV